MPDSQYKTPEGFFDEHFIYVLSPQTGAIAQLTIAGEGNAFFLFSALHSGSYGNTIQVTFNFSGVPNTPQSITVDLGLKTIHVELGVDGTGTNISTGATVSTLLNATPAVAQLVTFTVQDPTFTAPNGGGFLSGGTDGSLGYVTGENAFNQSIFVGSEADSFILRRIAGINTICRGFRYRDSQGRNRFQDLMNVPARLVEGSLEKTFELPVVPEVVFPAGSQIGFDLQNVQIDDLTGDITVQVGQIAFQGVRRFKKSAVYQTPYRYKEMGFSYVKEAQLTTAYKDDDGNVSAEQYVRIDVNNFDFELYCIYIRYTNPDDSGFTGQTFNYTLFNAYHRAVSSGPVSDIILNENCNQGGAVTPPLLFPVNTQIVIAIQSLSPFVGGGVNFELHFDGVNRMPCVGPGNYVP